MSRLWRQAVMGPGYLVHRRIIRRSKSWSVEDVQAYLAARRLAPRYRSVYPALRDKVFYRSRNPTTFERFPLLTQRVTTGGTTGEPLGIYRDRVWIRQKERAYLHDIWSYAGYQPFETRVVFRGTFSRTLVSYDVLENCHIVATNLLTRANARELIAYLERLEAFFLHVYPSSLFTFLDLIGEDSFRRLPIRGVLAGSELFPAGQMDHFNNRFGLPVAHWYGHSEYVVLARYAADIGRFLFYPTYGLVEFEPAADGSGLHRIIGTGYNRLGTRFIRYDTGDLARLPAGDERTTFPAASEIIGRRQEFFFDRGGERRPFGPYLFGIHGEFWDRIRDVQFRQSRLGHLDVLVVPGEGFTDRWFSDFLHDRFRGVTLAIEKVTSIPKTSQGKHRYFIQELKEDR